MRSFRQRLGRLAGAVLTAHLCLMAAVPASLYLDLRTATAECTCPEGDGGACPMHHKVTASSETQPCVFQSAAASRSDAILSLLGPVGVLAASVTVAHDMPSIPVTLVESPSVDTRAVPDSPPPRG